MAIIKELIRSCYIANPPGPNPANPLRQLPVRPPSPGPAPGPLPQVRQLPVLPIGLPIGPLRTAAELALQRANIVMANQTKVQELLRNIELMLKTATNCLVSANSIIRASQEPPRTPIGLGNFIKDNFPQIEINNMYFNFYKPNGMCYEAFFVAGVQYNVGDIVGISVGSIINDQKREEILAIFNRAPAKKRRRQEYMYAIRQTDPDEDEDLYDYFDCFSGGGHQTLSFSIMTTGRMIPNTQLRLIPNPYPGYNLNIESYICHNTNRHKSNWD